MPVDHYKEEHELDTDSLTEDDADSKAGESKPKE
jgi:hypothetical protein